MRLSETMLHGLRKMQEKHRRQDTVLAEPNDNTGRALEKRGLVEFVMERDGWRRYRVTSAGRAALEAQDGK